MSEYQHYEFRTVDRSLSQQEMDELRELSTRAQITPIRFVNVYHYADFRGSPSELMDKYFDIFVYVTNWSSHELMLRLPRTVLAPEAVEPYATSDWLNVRAVDDFVILEFTYFSEDGGGYWITDEEAASWLPALLPIREELARGDLRCLYLSWLSSASYWLEDDDVEPPIPPGLGKLSPALNTLAEFLWVDEALIEIAAERSAELDVFEPSEAELNQWIHDLSNTEKDALLTRLVTDGDTRLRAELLRRFQTETQAISAPASGERTVAELLAAAEVRAEERQREAEEREARKRAREAEKQAKAWAAYLDDITPRQDQTWTEVEALIAVKRANEYDRAVELLRALHDIAARDNQTQQFDARMRDLRERHSTKQALLKRFKTAGL